MGILVLLVSNHSYCCLVVGRCLSEQAGYMGSHVEVVDLG